MIQQYVFMSARAHPITAAVVGLLVIAAWVTALFWFPDHTIEIVAIPPAVAALVGLVDRFFPQTPPQ